MRLASLADHPMANERLGGKQGLIVVPQTEPAAEACPSSMRHPDLAGTFQASRT
jgi:hypothetical protein